MCKFILFLGYTQYGSKHDFSIFKKEFSTSKDWFEGIDVWLDLGYQGFQNLYKFGSVNQPIKKPRKSKKNPDPSLTEEEKTYNKEVSSKRIYVEHAIGGMKRYQIINSKSRIKDEELYDKIIFLCAGLWNFKLKNKKPLYADFQLVA